MNYKEIYNNIIERAKNRVLFDTMIELHHIIPRSEGGSNKKSNKIELTPKEHHLCHLCLIKMRMCLKYCFRHLSLREYCELKNIEKKKVRTNFRKLEKHWAFQEDYDKFKAQGF